MTGALVPLDTLAGEIRARLSKADATEAKAKDFRISAAEMLIEAKRRQPAEAPEHTWTSWCALYIQRSDRDVRRLLAIGRAEDRTAAVEKDRAAAREGMRTNRANVSPPEQEENEPDAVQYAAPSAVDHVWNAYLRLNVLEQAEFRGRL